MSNLHVIPFPARPSTAATEPNLRRLAASVLRRARVDVGLSQEALAACQGSGERSVRRRESGQSDLGALEDALRHPEFAAAVARELAVVAERLGARRIDEEREAA